MEKYRDKQRLKANKENSNIILLGEEVTYCKHLVTYWSKKLAGIKIVKIFNMKPSQGVNVDNQS